MKCIEILLTFLFFLFKTRSLISYPGTFLLFFHKATGVPEFHNSSGNGCKLFHQPHLYGFAGDFQIFSERGPVFKMASQFFKIFFKVKSGEKWKEDICGDGGRIYNGE